ncbi:MAG: hypothetical protein KAY37_11320 [Phycisphaerae bacterium]|nr:hypothetical protein [Phycisphaerae bacterium]
MPQTRRIVLIAVPLMMVSVCLPAGFAEAELELVLTSDPYVQAGEPVTCELWMDGISCEPEVPPATGFQAYLGFLPDKLEFIDGSYTEEPFGLPLMPIVDLGGALDLAAGTNPFQGQLPACGQHHLATLHFSALADGEGCNYIYFRDHFPETCIVDLEVNRILPELLSAPPSVSPVDFDADCDVDIVDFEVFSGCLAGPDVTEPPPGCDPLNFAAADLANDGDVDLEDFATFQTSFTGSAADNPKVVPNPKSNTGGA